MSRAAIFHLGINATTIQQCESTGIDPGIAVQSQAAGQIDPTFTSVTGISPRVTFSTSDVSAALGAIGLGGLALSSNAVVYMQTRAADGEFQAGANHMSWTLSNGLVVPRSLSVNQGGNASLTGEIIGRSTDGQSTPWTYSGTATLSGDNHVDNLFTLGPISINGTEVGVVQSLNIDFGLNVSVNRGDDDIYPTFLHINSRRPTIRYTTEKPVNLNTIGLAGSAQGSTDSVIYLRARANDGVLVADGTTSHLSLTVDAGIITPMNASVQADGHWASEFVITPRYDGTNDIVAIGTGVAIS